MKKIAIRNHIGDWVYYLTSLSFKEVSDNVCKITNELHESRTLSDMIQRGLTKNVEKIADYIESQQERFFNALVLAVYDGDPQWREIKIDYGEEEIYNIGVLEFTGNEKIFPVDGQHRVEGIKIAIEKNPEHNDETIPVIFIGHKKTKAGMQRTRRLFSTLNRYAKPVSLNDIIALDEDDSVAIATREVIENLDLFKGERIRNDRQKAIPEQDTKAFTNVISLYECNKELISYMIKDKDIFNDDGRKLKGKSKLDQYCRFRPNEEEITKHIHFVNDYWNGVSNIMNDVVSFLCDSNNDATEFRNRNGGSLLFRPIGQKPFTATAIKLYEKYHDWTIVINKMNKLNLNINEKPWLNVVWNEISNKMQPGANSNLIELLLSFMINENLLSDNDINKLINSYREKQLYSVEEIKDEEILEELERYQIQYV